MRLLILKDYDDVCIRTANYIIERINAFAPTREKPFVMALPTGSSALGVYKNLISAHKEGKVSFSNVVSFNLDEYLGLPGDHPQSYRHYMKENFFSSIDIRSENAHIPDGMADDPEEECNLYEEKIRVHGGIELFIGGMGVNGHIAFNEPGTSLASRTSVQILARDTIIANARFFDGDPRKVPVKAITMGIGTATESREMLIISSGRQKAKALKDMVEGPLSHWNPLSCLQIHPKAVVFCDEDAAEELKYSTVRYYKHIEGLE
ncbi:MAG: glucosamine-6-phosphate deaminase [Treponema sp.]|nr:glucosamine-6-phosphate deaminase [Treponema sp.]